MLDQWIVTLFGCSALLFSSTLRAGDRPPAIDFGAARIDLGMQASDAATRLRSAGYKLLEGKNGDYTILLFEQLAGALRASDGRVTFVQRDWTVLAPDTGKAFADAVLGAVHTAVPNGPAKCIVAYVTNENPGWSENGIAITCGTRRIFVTSTKSSTVYGDTGRAYVQEVIGPLPCAPCGDSVENTHRPEK